MRNLDKKESIYDNGVILAPNGEMLCRCASKKIKWYLDRDLAIPEPNEPQTIRLKFEPKGRHNSQDAIMLSKRDNICVVCGHTENLTRHHIVPFCYRKYLPEDIKKHDSYDIVPLCIKCHGEYEKVANRLKIKMEKESGYFSNDEAINVKVKVKKASQAYLKFNNVMSEKKIEKIYGLLRIHYNKLNIAKEDIELAAEMDVSHINFPELNKSEFIVKQYGDLQKFVEYWRSHFISTMKPQHMFEGYYIERPVGKK